MKSQPLQTAFTSMTIALVIFLSLWVIQASQEELLEKSRVPLQVKSGTSAGEARIDPRPDPFDDSETAGQPRPTAERPSRNQLAEAPSREIPSETVPEITIQGVEVRAAATESRAKAPADELDPFAISTNPPALTVPEEQDSVADLGPELSTAPVTLGRPDLPLPSVDESLAPLATELDPGTDEAQARIERMQEDLAAEAEARQQLQARIDSLTREHSELKSALIREQSNVGQVRQEKEQVAEQLKTSESELNRLKSTARELRSETTEMKRSLQNVTSEFDELRKRFEELQRKPREVASLPASAAERAGAEETEAVREFKQPVTAPLSGGGETRLAPPPPPSDDAQVPLIPAEPMLLESDELDASYPPMVMQPSRTAHRQDKPRGLLPMLFGGLKREEKGHTGSCADCSETGCADCRAEVVRPGCIQPIPCGIPHVPSEPFICGNRGSAPLSPRHGVSECGCYEGEAARGLLPKIARWIEARQTRGYFEGCCCDHD
jgi:hypothetical protein